MLKFAVGFMFASGLGALWLLLEMVKADMLGFGYIINILTCLFCIAFYSLGKIPLTSGD